MGPLGRGLAAGAAGTAALNIVTYADMAWRGRPPSRVPEEMVAEVLRRMGVSLPGSGDEAAHRLAGLGPLAGMATGLSVGVVASLARSLGVRTPGPVGAVLTGAAAMAASDVSMGLLGVSDPRSWTAEEWATDAVPHAVYGVVTQWVLRALEKPKRLALPAAPARAPEPLGAALPPASGLQGRAALPVPPLAPEPPEVRRTPHVLPRAFALGLASGGRSMTPLAMLATTTPRGTAVYPLARPLRLLRSPVGRSLAVTAAGGELVADKLPQTPSRLDPPALAGRVGTGAVSAAGLAQRSGVGVVLPALFGAAGSAAGSYAGAAWRAWADRRVPDWQAALAEDAVTVLVARWGAA